MTNVEIVEALRCCVTTACSGCPIDNGDPMSIECMGYMAGAAADLIEKLTDRCARYAEEIAVLQAKQKWIPVTERLPEVEEFEEGGGMSKVILGIVKNDSGFPPPNPCFCVYLSDGRWMLRGKPVTVTHWRPLPDGPEEAAND